MRKIIIYISLFTFTIIEPDKALTKHFFTYKTAHYTIITDVSNRFAKKLGEKMEKIYKAYYSIFRGIEKDANVPEPKNLRVVVFNNEDDFNKQKQKDGLPKWAYGYFNGHYEDGISTIYMFNDTTNRRHFWGTLRHEGFHQFLKYYSREVEVPVWFNEGFAEFFNSSLRLKYNPVTQRYRVRIKKIWWRIGLLEDLISQRGYIIPLKKLMNMSYKSFYSNSQAGCYYYKYCYSMAWATVYTLVSPPDRAYMRKYHSFISNYITTIIKKGSWSDIKSAQIGWKLAKKEINIPTLEKHIIMLIKGSNAKDIIQRSKEETKFKDWKVKN